MKKPAMSRSLVLALIVIVAAGIIGLVFVAPIAAAVLFVFLATAGAIAIGRKDGGWRGFVAFAKDLIFGW
jgi:hypothetical protein